MAVIIGLTLAACHSPQFDGPQIQEPPAGFLFDPVARQNRNMFQGREQIQQGAWWKGEVVDVHSSIFITVHPRSTAREEVLAARDFQAREDGDPDTEYGDIQTFQVDNRTAWGWTEIRGVRGEVSSYELSVVVPYDTVSFAVEFYSNDPEWMDEAKMREVVESFAFGRVTWDLPLVGLTLLVLAFAGVLIKNGTKKGVTRAYKLAQIPKPSDDDLPEAPEATANDIEEPQGRGAP